MEQFQNYDLVLVEEEQQVYMDSVDTYNKSVRELYSLTIIIFILFLILIFLVFI